MNLAPTYIVTDGSVRANVKDSQAHKTLSSAPVSEPGVGYMTYAVSYTHLTLPTISLV